jgi:hypothetical protein
MYNNLWNGFALSYIMYNRSIDLFSQTIKHHFAQDVNSRSEQNEDVSYIEMWLWCFCNFNSTEKSCITSWQLTSNFPNCKTTSHPCTVLSKTDDHSASLLNEMYTSVIIEKFRTVKNNQTSVWNLLTPEFGKRATIIAIHRVVISIGLCHHFGHPLLSVFRRHRSDAKGGNEKMIDRFWCPKSVYSRMWSLKRAL